jgi:hypothetical protein
MFPTEHGPVQCASLDSEEIHHIGYKPDPWNFASWEHANQGHYLASLLIASGADIKTVQARMRHATARTTLDTYGHLWPDADESTRTAVGAVIRERFETTADALRTDAP